MRGRIAKLILMGLGAATLLALSYSPALAQCAMCKAAAAGASGGALGRNLNTAILVLLVPPVTIFCAIFFVAYRYRMAPGEAPGENRKEKRRAKLAWLKRIVEKRRD
jgi:heme/copper-type cytochrome/quinol oxidase subunit 2